MMKIVYIILLFINIVSFILYGYDKRQAVREGYRIPEKTLLFWAVIGGAYGALLGMRIFHHKTRKSKFYITVPLLTVIWTVLIVFSFTHPAFPVF